MNAGVTSSDWEDGLGVSTSQVMAPSVAPRAAGSPGDAPPGQPLGLSLSVRVPPDSSAVRTLPAFTGPILVLLADAAAVAGTYWARGASAAALISAVAFVVAVSTARSYRLPLSLSALEVLPGLVPPLILSALVAAVAWEGTPQELFVTTLGAAVALSVGRSVAYALVRHLRTVGRLGDRTVVIGDGPLTAELVTALREHPAYGVRTVGVLQQFDDGCRGPIDVDTIGEVLAALEVRRVIMSYCQCPDADLVPLLRAVVAADVQVHLVPRFFDLGVDSVGLDHVWGVPLLRLRRAALRRPAWWMRRATEVLVAYLLLVLSLVPLALVALAVRLSSPGPVLFRQPRLGQDGRSFMMVKFRTLRVDDDPDIGVVLDLREGSDLPVQARRQLEVERRLTGVGRFLRSTGLDELPQLLSVIKGDMSLVGARPEELIYAKRFSSAVRGYPERHRLPVGLTGWAQVHGLRGETSIAQRVRFDNNYIEHWSLWRDVVITLRTVGVLLRRFARREA